MGKFVIKVADRVIGINTIHTRTKALCRDFIVEEIPDFEIDIEQAEIDEQKAIFTSKIKNRFDLWDGLAEVSVVLKKISHTLIDYNTILFHGAVIALNGKAYIFTGKSGIGKSTHVRHWIKNCPNAFIVNGDKPFLVIDNEPKACGSPWAGKEIQYTNIVVPIRAIIFMERNECNSISEISFPEAFPLLLQQVYYLEDEEKMRRTLHLLKGLDKKVLFYRFQCNNYKDDCFETAYRTLVGDDE